MKLNNNKKSVKISRNLFMLYAVMVCGIVFALPAFAVDDPLVVVENLSTFIFSLIRAVGLILLGCEVLYYSARPGACRCDFGSVVLCLLLLIPGNMLIHHIAGDVNVVASLPPQAALILIVLATLLTMLGGVIPARSAAKSNPVKALRSE